jgi:subtilisin-like proprotein convertase family protein
MFVTLCGFCHTGSGQEVPGFGPLEGEKPLPGFGASAELYAELAALVIESDRQKAIRDVKKADKNGDWVLDAAEMKAVGWSLEKNDVNGDGRIPLREMTLRWAQYRTRNDRAPQAQPAPRKANGHTGTPRAAESRQRPRLPTDPDVRARNQLAGNVARQIMASFDKDGDSILERKEWQSNATKFGNVAAADLDRDGQIDVPELAQWFSQRLPSLASSRLAPDLRVLDSDRDGQVAMAEFADEFTEETLAEFRRYDRNADGLITPEESLTAIPTESDYLDDQTRVLQPMSVVASEIWIDEDFVIDDIDVRVLIARRGDDQLRLSLEGPDGQSVLLFRGRWQPWRGAPLFDNTVLDDEAKPINNAPRPPAGRKTFPPEGVGKNDVPSLSYFYGKRSRGSWRLIVRNLGEVGTGWLREWSLIIKRREN